MSQNWTPPPASTPASIPNYLVMAIISLFCCMPLGIVAIIFAAQVNSKLATGDIQGAMSSSKTAKICSMVAIALGLVWVIFCVVLWVLGIGLSILSSSTGR